jgi:hypothetical protein
MRGLALLEVGSDDHDHRSHSAHAGSPSGSRIRLVGFERLCLRRQGPQPGAALLERVESKLRGDRVERGLQTLSIRVSNPTKHISSLILGLDSGITLLRKKPHEEFERHPQRLPRPEQARRRNGPVLVPQLDSLRSARSGPKVRDIPLPKPVGSLML